MNCPVCKAKNVTAAHILGHGGKGVSKTISKADRLGRSERMKALNAKRRDGFGERFSSGDGERRAWQARGISYEPLPAAPCSSPFSHRSERKSQKVTFSV